MAAHLIALTADGGIPLFTRRIGDVKALPFSAIGTLNGVHMFSRLRGSELKSAVTSGETILWRVYHNSVVLILITSNDACSECHMAHLIDNIFAAMILLVGLDSVCNQSNVERLKRELKVCYTIIDHLLSQMDQDLATTGDLTQAVDCLLSHETQSLQIYMEKFLEIADTNFGCLLVRGKIVVASKKWWTFTHQELVLLSAFINSLPKSTSRDIPIYLPFSCPRICNRLLTLQLVQGVELCVLCSNTPALSYLEDEAPKIWKGSFELLKMVSSLHPRNFPSNIVLDKNVLGVLLIHTVYQQSMCSIQPVDDDSIHQKGGKSVNLKKRQEALRTLYKIVIGTFMNDECNSDSRIGADNSFTCSANSKGSRCEAHELYLCTEQHKCYVIKSSPYQLFLLFNTNVPTFAARSVSHNILKSLTVKKLFNQ